MQRYVKIKCAPSLMPKSFWLNFIAISMWSCLPTNVNHVANEREPCCPRMWANRQCASSQLSPQPESAVSGTLRLAAFCISCITISSTFFSSS